MSRNLVAVDEPPAGSTDLHAFPPSLVELNIAEWCLIDPLCFARLADVCGGRDRAEVIYCIAVWRHITKEVSA